MMYQSDCDLSRSQEPPRSTAGGLEKVSQIVVESLLTIMPNSLSDLMSKKNLFSSVGFSGEQKAHQKPLTNVGNEMTA